MVAVVLPSGPRRAAGRGGGRRWRRETARHQAADRRIAVRSGLLRRQAVAAGRRGGRHRDGVPAGDRGGPGARPSPGRVDPGARCALGGPPTWRRGLRSGGARHGRGLRQPGGARDRAGRSPPGAATRGHAGRARTDRGRPARPRRPTVVRRRPVPAEHRRSGRPGQGGRPDPRGGRRPGRDHPPDPDQHLPAPAAAAGAGPGTAGPAARRGGRPRPPPSASNRRCASPACSTWCRTTSGRTSSRWSASR